MNNCAFCGPTKERMTPEDIIPHWFSIFHKRSRSNRTFQGVDIHGGRLFVKAPRQRIDDRIDNIVCEKCNSGFMSRLETKAKSILIPILKSPSTPKRFTEDERRALATWQTVKTIVVNQWEVATHGEAPLFTHDERAAVKATLSPLDNTRVWIAHLEHPNYPRRIFNRDAVCNFTYHPFAWSSDDNKRRLDGLAWMFALRHVALQLIVVKSPTAESWPDAADSVSFAFDPVVGTWEDFAPRLWPINSTVVVDWPPRRQLLPVPPYSSFEWFLLRLMGFS